MSPAFYPAYTNWDCGLARSATCEGGAEKQTLGDIIIECPVYKTLQDVQPDGTG